jgi:glyoxylase-like metal-dependent hydrolase (beta-lactamase superfamily II)
MFIKCLTVGQIETNCYIACDKVTNRAAIIDPGADANRIITALNETGCEADYVILTHGHVDHMSAAHEVLRATGAKLAVFADELELINDPDKSLYYTMHSQPFERFKPEVLMKDGDILSFGSISLKVIHTPGHTQGSCCLIGQDTLFSGDTLFRGNVGRCDLPTGSSFEIAKSITRLLALDGDLQVLPGHGEFTTLEYERRHNPFSGRNVDETIS